jgi:hypothetical protein
VFHNEFSGYLSGTLQSGSLGRSGNRQSALELAAHLVFGAVLAALLLLAKLRAAHRRST